MADSLILNSIGDNLIEKPYLSLDFYSYGIMMTRRDGELITEGAVDPLALARTIAINVPLKTGILNPNVLFMSTNGESLRIAEFRPARLTGIFLEGSPEPLRVPLPPLVLIHDKDDTSVFAVKKRPSDYKAKLYHAPLPNVFASGSICWGTVPRLISENSLQTLWEQFLGSRFGGHAVNGKSQTHPLDIRKKLMALNGQKRYPLSDLQPVRTTLEEELHVV